MKALHSTALYKGKWFKSVLWYIFYHKNLNSLIFGECEKRDFCTSLACLLSVFNLWKYIYLTTTK